MWSTPAASSFPWGPASVSTFVPFEKNSGAPHSSVSTCAVSWQRIEWYDWHVDASASEFAAVPLNAKKTSQSVSKISRRRSAFASTIAAQASGQTPA